MPKHDLCWFDSIIISLECLSILILILIEISKQYFFILALWGILPEPFVQTHHVQGCVRQSKNTQNMPNNQLHCRGNVEITIKDKDIYLFISFRRKPAFTRTEWTKMNLYCFNLSTAAQFNSILFFHENLQTCSSHPPIHIATYIHVGGARAHQIDSECIP